MMSTFSLIVYKKKKNSIYNQKLVTEKDRTTLAYAVNLND